MDRESKRAEYHMGRSKNRGEGAWEKKKPTAIPLLGAGTQEPEGNTPSKRHNRVNKEKNIIREICTISSTLAEQKHRQTQKKRAISFPLPVQKKTGNIIG